MFALDLAIGGATPRVSAALQAVCAGVATWASARAIRRAPARWRRAWQLLTCSSALWLVGALVAIVTDGNVADDTFPTVLDVCRIAALLLAVVALMTVPDRHDRWRRALLGLDGLVLAASLLYVGWTLHTGSRYGAADLDAGPRAVLLIHLGVDAVVFGFAVGLLVRAPQRGRLPAALVSVAFVVAAVTDVVYLDRGLGTSFGLGSPSDLGWAALLVLVAAAALNASAEPSEVTDRVSDRIIMGASLVALIPLIVVFFISVVRTPLEGAPHTVEWLLLASAVVLCVIARFVTLRDNIALSDELAEDVAARSDELGAAVHLQRLTLNAVHEGIVGLREGQLVFANDAAGEILHVPRDELLGRYVFEVVTIGPADHSKLAEIYAAITARQHIEFESEPAVRVDGTTFAMDLSITPVVHPDLTSVAVFRDVSHRTEVERLKNEFVSVVSHELRTPLTSIRGSLGLLAGGAVGELSPPAQRMAVIATENTERLIRLINDILDLERIESGAVVLDLAPCPAAELIATSLEVVVPVAGRDGRRRGDRTDLRHRARRRRPSGAGARQPARQRREVLAAGHDGHRRRRAHRRARPVHRARPRSGHPRRPAGADLRPLPPGRRLGHPPAGRHRAGAGDLRLDRPPARRADLGREHATAARRSRSPCRPRRRRRGEPVRIP